MESVFAGFGTRVEINKTKILCTSLSVNDTNILLESSGGYGGTINGSDKRGVSGPFLLDTGGISLSIGLEPSEKQLTDLTSPFKTGRHSVWEVVVHGPSVNSTYTECMMESANVKCSNGGALAMDFNYTVMQLWPFKSGTFGGNATAFGIGSIPFTELVPYWTTSITNVPNPTRVISWDVSFNQTVVKKYFCSGEESNSTCPLPKYASVGPLGIQLNVETFIGKDTVSMLSAAKESGSVVLSIGGVELFNFEKVTSASAAPSILGGRQTMSLTYKVCKWK